MTCDCKNHKNQVCDICQSVTGNEKDQTPSPARTLAEKIVDKLLCQDCDTNRDLGIKDIESLLQAELEKAVEERGQLFQESVANFPKELAEAKREAFDDYKEGEKARYENGIHWAKKEAYLDAAKIAEEFVKDSSYPIEKMSAEVIAAKLRAKASE